MYLVVTTTLLVLGALALFLARGRIGLLASATGAWAITALYVVFGFDPPTPKSLAILYVAILTVAFLLYVTSSEEALRAVWPPVKAVLVDRERRWPRWLVYLLLPGAVAWQTHRAMLPDTLPPPRVRSAHPAPPATIDLRARGAEAARTLDPLREDSPYRDADPETVEAAVTRGRVVYYENCFFCHGDTLSGDGHYADALDPPPADFTDPTILPMFVDGFFFWRIAKGGPGLPVDGAPWDSTMPAWEHFLDEEEMWSVLAYVSDRTGHTPRARETYETYR